MINNLRAFQEVLKRNNLPTPDTYLGISELIRSLYRPDVSPNPERIREVLEELTWPVTVPAGNPITFKSCSEVLASEALVTFAPKQSGTGDPSPENIRPISGLDSLSLYQGEAHTATFLSTVYGGSYDFVQGSGQNKISSVNLADLTWVYDSTYQRFNSTLPLNAKMSVLARHKYIICSCYLPITDKRPISEVPNYSIYRGTTRDISIHDSRFTDPTDLITALSGQTACYELATPQEITLTPADVNLLKGSNTVWTDGDTVQIKFQVLK